MMQARLNNVHKNLFRAFHCRPERLEGGSRVNGKLQIIFC